MELERVFSPNLVFVIEGKPTKDVLFRFVARKLAEEGVIRDEDQEVVVEKLEEREKKAPTGIGKGVALPHIFLPGLESLLGAAVLLPSGVDWQAVDKEEVKLAIFVFAGEDQRQEYLRTMAEVARVLRADRLRNRIFKTTDPQRIYEMLRGVRARETFLAGYHKYLYFFLGLIVFYLFSRFCLSAIKLPYEGFYLESDLVRFNEPIWIGREILTTTLFFSMVLGTLLFFEYRVAIGALALGALLLFGVEEIDTAVKFMSIPTILFIMGTMVIVRWLENKGFFRFLVANAIKRLGNSPYILSGMLMLFSAILSALVGEVSAILVTFQIAIEIARVRRTPIIPYLLALVFATNIGSALTLIGNPIGIFLAFSAKLTFLDFLKYATPISLLTASIIIPFLLYFYRKHFKSEVPIDPSTLRGNQKVANSHDLLLSSTIFGLFVMLIVLHAFLEKRLNLPDRTVLLAAPLIVTGLLVFLEREKGRFLIERGPDWWTILYFMFLFSTAACLEYTGVTAKFARFIYLMGERLPLKNFGEWGRTGNALLMLLWGSGLLSGFVDNLPIVAALVPVVKALALHGLPNAHMLWWSLLIGGCFGGNLTMIGSTANLVAIGVYERQFRQKFLFRDWIRLGAIVTLSSLTVASVLLILMLILGI